MHPIGVLKEIPSVRDCRPPVLPFFGQIPAYVVAMEMSQEHRVDILGFDAIMLEVVHQLGRTRSRFWDSGPKRRPHRILAHASVHQDRSVAWPDYERKFIMNPLEPNASGKRSRYGSQTLTEVSENSMFMGKGTTPSETEVMFMFPISRRCPVSDVVINAPLSASIMLIFRPVAGRPRLFVSRIAPRHLSLPEPTLHLQNHLGLFHYRWLFRR